MGTRALSSCKLLVHIILPLVVCFVFATPEEVVGVDGMRNFPSRLTVGDIVHVATGEKVSFPQLSVFFDAARIVYVGEQHKNVESHEFQLRVLEEFYQKYGDNIAIGMEMFKRPYQHVLDRWVNKEISEEELLRGTHWRQEWGYDFGLYRDILYFARDKGIPVIALNITRELQKTVSRKGLKGLSDAERKRLPEIDTSDFYHRRYLRRVFEEHVDISGDFERFYDVQCVWEDVMADSISRYLSSPQGRGRKFLAFMGDSHIIYHFGVPKRVFRHMPLPYYTIYTYELRYIRPGEEHILFLSDIPLQPADFVKIIRPSRREEKRAILGVMIRDIGRDRVVIQDVLRNSPAEVAGLEVGDVILSMDEQQIREVHDVVHHLRLKRLGEECRIVVSRGGEEMRIKVSFFEFEAG